MTKAALRTLYKAKRTALSAEQCLRYDQIISACLMEVDWSGYRYVHVFQSISKFNEPRLTLFINALKTNFPQVQTVTSKSDLLNGELKHIVVDASTEMEDNAWGIPEPISGLSIDEKQIDVVLVPLLIADAQGNRVGYGKGFYDRFLAKCRPEVCTIGVSYFAPIDKIDDIDPWDIPLLGYVSPFGLLDFGRDSQERIPLLTP